ncbi:unnamed protein product [Gemmataceae bacterium]|nr:unnamed protein product [Gemmataceae bacterium]VTT98868.1 unnamed protein product [Gemmataceae bacterium]
MQTGVTTDDLNSLEALEAEFYAAGQGFVELSRAIAEHKRAAVWALAAGADPAEHLAAVDAAREGFAALRVKLAGLEPAIEAARRALTAGG